MSFVATVYVAASYSAATVEVHEDQVVITAYPERSAKAKFNLSQINGGQGSSVILSFLKAAIEAEKAGDDEFDVNGALAGIKEEIETRYRWIAAHSTKDLALLGRSIRGFSDLLNFLI